MNPDARTQEVPPVRVMIADDVQETCRSIRLMLSMIPGVEVVATVQNGLQACELARQNPPDLTLMDVNMPEMDGLTAIQNMLAENPELFCVVISAERDTQTLRQAKSIGARGFLVKPFTFEELEEVIDQASQQMSKRRLASVESTELERQRDAHLKQLAREYSAVHRVDDQALKVYEQLAASAVCEPRWLMTLAMAYVVRGDWGKLKNLAERLEKQAAIAMAA